MASVVQFTVDDSSPTVLYAPIGDTFGPPNLSAGWNPHWDNPGFSSANLGAIGSGTSLHITSLNNASLQIQWKGLLLNVGPAIPLTDSALHRRRHNASREFHPLVVGNTSENVGR